MHAIRPACTADAGAIKDITHAAFKLYQDELAGAATVTALRESTIDIVDDILHRKVFIAEENSRILGAIRYVQLSADLAYIYRFAVAPHISNTGVGSDLLEYVLNECIKLGIPAVCLHTNSKYYKLARYYYGKQFFVHSTDNSKGYIRALFVKELLKNAPYDISPAFLK
ncbi:MAG: GNAT family N-acetyltransferase [Firmicutes bacterium]|nr:GNAT family N-acetyltransferase [Bacillota bacterium]